MLERHGIIGGVVALLCLSPLACHEPTAMAHAGEGSVSISTGSGVERAPRGVVVEVIAAPGALPKALQGMATAEMVPDVIDARRVSGQVYVLLLRPGDLILRTRDAGRHWEWWRSEMPLASIVPGDGLWWSLTDIDELGRANRVARSRDEGKTWELRMTGQRLEPSPRLMLSYGDGLALATGPFVLRGQRVSEQWQWSNPQVASEISAFSTEESADGVRYWVGAQGRVAWKHGEEGAWQVEAVDTALLPQVYAVVPRPERGDHLAATSGGLYWRRSGGDGSVGWQHVGSLGRHTYFDAAFQGELGVAVGASGEVAVSDDGGLHWHRVTAEVMEAFAVSSAREKLDANWRYVFATSEGFLLLGDGLRIGLLRL